MNGIALTLASLFALAATAATTAAQSATPLVLTGDAVPGGARVTGIGAVHVGTAGDWLVETTTDAPGNPSLVLRWFGPWKQTGDPVSQPAGATIAAFGSFSTELFGGVAWIARLDGTAGGTEDDEAVYFQNKLWLQEGPVGGTDSTNLPAGSRWLSFDDVRCSSNRGSVLFRGHLDDPTIAGPDETYLAIGSLCGSIGVLCTVDRLVSSGQPAPGLASIIESVRVTPAQAAISPSGLRFAWSCDLRGDPTLDGCVYRLLWGFGAEQHVLIAREGSPSPVTGRRWGPLDNPAVDVNSSGSWTLCATLDESDPTTDAVLVQDDVVLAREGDSPPSVAPAVLVGFGRGPALIDEAGQVVWYGRLSGPGGGSEALFLDGEVLVRTGVTQIGGRTLTRIDGGVDAMSLSPQGDLLVFTGTLAGGSEGAFVIGGL
jgi:hypothetical protein